MPMALSGILRREYRLTPQEATIAEMMALGLSPSQIAAETGARVNTVRTQIKRIFAKTGCHRQSQVAVLVLRHVPQSS
jgi:DNA-binding CsgD family transcriptional regulator